MKRLVPESPFSIYSIVVSLALIVFIGSSLVVRSSATSMMLVFVVNSTADSADATPGDGVCLDSLNRCTLRAAVMEANASAGVHTITVPAGTYTLTQGPFDNEFNFSGADEATGDIDIQNHDLSIIGAGSASTIIDGGAIDRIFDANNPSGSGVAVNLTLQGLTLRNGNAPTTPEGFFEAGGAIQFDGTNFPNAEGTLTINNCRIINSTASGLGGGIFATSAKVIIDGSEISGNTTTHANGGGMAYDGGLSAPNQSLLLTNSNITNNNAPNATFGSGAGLWVGGGISKTIRYNSITNNHAGARGGGVFNGNGSLILSYNVIVGNTATSDPSSSGFRNNAGTATVENDWWGCNQGPGFSPCDRASGALGSGIFDWLTLNHTANPNAIQTNSSTTLQADFYTNNLGNAVAPTDLVALNGRAVTFNNPVLGTISGADTQIFNGKANATFTAGATGGTGSADATVDHATATATINITQQPSITSCQSDIVVPNDTNACTATVSFNVSAGGFPTPTITYTVNGNAITSPYAFSVGTTTVVATASNGAGPDVTCQFTVTVNDNQNPTVTAPPNVNVSTGPGATECGATISDATLGTASASDNCPGVTVTRSGVPAGNNFPIGTTTITYTATDAHGNTATATQTVTVTDNTVPTITAPPAVSTGTGAGSTSCTANVSDATLGTASASDNCPGVTVTRSGVPSGNNFPVGTTTVTYTATDAHGNTATATQTVTVVDNTAPTLSLPASLTANASGSCQAAIPDLTASSNPSDNCTPTGSLSFSQSPAAGTLVGLGPHTVTLTVTDAAGNSSTATTNFIVNDTTNPTITAPAPVTVNANSSCTATGVALGTPTTADNCSVASVTNNAPASFPLGTTTVTWTVTDGSGNTATATQTVTVVDHQNPTITAPSAITVSADSGSCSATGVSLGTPTTADNCSVASVTNNAPSTYPLGTTTVTWTVTDGSGNTATATQTVTVVDTEKPSLTAPSNVTVATSGSSCSAVVSDAQLGSASASDNCAGPVTITRSGVPAGNVFPVGTTTITYTATDAHGNTRTATQTVTVTDGTPPTITLNGPNPMTVECHTGFVDPGATAHDACAGDFAATASGVVNTNSPGTYTITYTAHDPSGNNATPVTRTVIVVDTTAPVINLSQQSIELWPPNHKYETFNVTDFVSSVTDSCSSNLNVSNVVIAQVTSDEVDDSPNGGDGNTVNDIVIAANCKSVQLRAERDGNLNGRVYTITFRVRDAQGNVATKTARVTVPANQGNGGAAVDSGVHNTVTSSCP